MPRGENNQQQQGFLAGTPAELAPVPGLRQCAKDYTHAAHLVEVSGVAGLNVTMTAAVLVAELLAELQLRTGDTPEALVAQSRLYISQRVACFQTDDAAPSARVLN